MSKNVKKTCISPNFEAQQLDSTRVLGNEIHHFDNKNPREIENSNRFRVNLGRTVYSCIHAPIWPDNFCLRAMYQTDGWNTFPFV